MATRINKREYAWGDISIFLFGQPVLGIRGIEYKTVQKKEYLRGAGRRPLGVQRGELEYPGTLTLLQSDLEALNRSARAQGYDSIKDVPMDIVVTYSTDGIVTVDKIHAAEITELPKGMKQGDMHSEHALPFLALDIEEGIAA